MELLLLSPRDGRGPPNPFPLLRERVKVLGEQNVFSDELLKRALVFNFFVLSAFQALEEKDC